MPQQLLGTNHHSQLATNDVFLKIAIINFFLSVKRTFHVTFHTDNLTEMSKQNHQDAANYIAKSASPVVFEPDATSDCQPPKPPKKRCVLQ